MTADWGYLDHQLLRRISNRIINEVRGIHRWISDPSCHLAGVRTWAHGETELFNLGEDLTASTNVLEQNFKRARAMRKALTTWLSNPEGASLADDAELSAEAMASLEALGYGGGTTGGAVGASWTPRPGSEWNQRFED